MDREDSFEVESPELWTNIENYEVIRKIGSGAFGEVYEAIDLSNSKTQHSRVAIKIV